MAVADVAVNQIGKTFKLRSGLGEDLLAAFYLRMKQEGTLPVFFHEKPDITLREFLDWHDTKTMTYLGCFLEDHVTGRLDLCGVGYINGLKRVGSDSIAEVGIGFLKEFQQPRITREFTELLLDFCFIEQRLTAVFGSSPTANRAIHIFARRMGFTVHKPDLPFFAGWFGQLTSARVFSMTAAGWISRREV